MLFKSPTWISMEHTTKRWLTCWRIFSLILRTDRDQWLQLTSVTTSTFKTFEDKENQQDPRDLLTTLMACMERVDANIYNSIEFKVQLRRTCSFCGNQLVTSDTQNQLLLGVHSKFEVSLKVFKKPRSVSLKCSSCSRNEHIEDSTIEKLPDNFMSRWTPWAPEELECAGEFQQNFDTLRNPKHDRCCWYLQ